MSKQAKDDNEEESYDNYTNGNNGNIACGDDGEDGSDNCSREGCTKECCLTCRGCGITGYCGELHMVEDWKNHHEDCAVAIHDIASPATWLVESAEREEEDGSIDWEPSDMVHAKIAGNGLIGATALNVDLVDQMQGKCMTHLIEGHAAGEGFVAKDVFKREVGKPGVTTGEKKSGSGRVHVTFMILSYGSTGPAINIRQQPFALDDVSKGASSNGGEGTTIFVNEQRMATIKSDVTRNTVAEIDAMAAQNGMHKLVMRVDMPDGSIFTLDGDFSFAKGPATARGKKARSEGYAAYAKGGVKQLRYRARRGASKAAASIRKLPQFVRVTAHDVRGVKGSATFSRSRKSNAAVYVLRTFAMHVPKDLTGETGATPVPDLMMQPRDASSAPPASDETPVNAESLIDVVALMDAIADHHDELQRSFIGAQQQPPSAETTKATASIRTTLNEAARIHRVLTEHANVLREEEDGTREIDDIPVEVNEAINQAQSMIGLNVRERYLKFRNLRSYQKNVSGLSSDQLKEGFLTYIVQLKATRGAGNVGTDLLKVARAMQQEILSGRRPRLVQDPQVLLALQDFNRLRSTDRTAYKNKRDTFKLEKQEQRMANKNALDNRRDLGSGNTRSVLSGIDKDDDEKTDEIVPPPATPQGTQSMIKRRVV